jgi:hypothetical protein
MNSKVKWDGNISKSFDEQQGVRHGGIVSPELYKVMKFSGISPNWLFAKYHYFGFNFTNYVSFIIRKLLL